MSGLFSSFSVAKRGMAVQQTALHTNAHNISNMNTDGYSVQRANLKTTEPFGMPSLTTSAEPGQLGTGVKVDSITRARDKFIDFQIRREKSTLSRYESREQFLTEIEAIFMEPSDEGLANMMTKFWDSWHQLATNPESSTARTLVSENGESLTTAIKHMYGQLEDMELNAGDLIRNEVFDTASILKQVEELNKQIKAVTISGRNPNDLMDRRDLLMDELSNKFSFDVEETEYNGMIIKPKFPFSSSLKEGILKDGEIKYGISYVNDIAYGEDGWSIQFQVNGDINKVVTLSGLSDDEIKDYFQDSNVFTAIKEKLNDSSLTDEAIKSIIVAVKSGLSDDELETKISEIYTGSIDENKLDGVKNLANSCTFVHTAFYDMGKYDGNASSFSAIPAAVENGSLNGFQTITDEINKYKTQLNNLARSIAISVNTLHSNSIDLNNGVNFFNSSAETEVEAAKFIGVTKEIIKDPSKINAGIEIPSNSGNGERALLIGQLRNTRMDILDINNRGAFINNTFKKADGSKLTSVEVEGIKADGTGINLAVEDLLMSGSQTGSEIDSYFKNSIAFLGVSNQEAKRMVGNQNALLSQLEIRRESVSGVSLDEEITNMIQFQRSYQANAKMISTIDQLLDVVVNGLIR